MLHEISHAKSIDISRLFMTVKLSTQFEKGIEVARCLDHRYIIHYSVGEQRIGSHKLVRDTLHIGSS
jgi:hypothetical protein